MTKIPRTITTTLIIAGASIIFTINAEASSYAFSIDRLSVVGNLPVNFVDEFDDGSIGSMWDINDPTVVESGGMLTLQSPGGVEQLKQVGNPRISSEMSYIAYEGPMQNGSGDFQVTSTWSPVVPDTNQLYNMNIRFSGIDPEITLMVYNFDTIAADFLGIPQGVGILFGELRDADTNDFSVQGASITPGNITGDILLRFTFADDTDLVAGDFSLDGGATFQSPFSPLAPTGITELQDIDFSFGAESWELTTVPIPGAVWLFGSGLLGLLGMSRRLRSTKLRIFGVIIGSE